MFLLLYLLCFLLLLLLSFILLLLWVQVGIEGTNIKAGIIKCAHETGLTWDAGLHNFTEAGDTTARACARAAKATGLPITTHTQVAERIGLAQIKIFEEEGVDMNRVYIGRESDHFLTFLASSYHSNPSWSLPLFFVSSLCNLPRVSTTVVT